MQAPTNCHVSVLSDKLIALLIAKRGPLLSARVTGPGSARVERPRVLMVFRRVGLEREWKKKKTKWRKKELQGFREISKRYAIISYFTLWICNEVVNRKLKGLFRRCFPIFVQIFRHFQEAFVTVLTSFREFSRTLVCFVYEQSYLVLSCNVQL